MYIQTKPSGLLGFRRLLSKSMMWTTLVCWSRWSFVALFMSFAKNPKLFRLCYWRTVLRVPEDLGFAFTAEEVANWVGSSATSFLILFLILSTPSAEMVRLKRSMRMATTVWTIKSCSATCGGLSRRVGLTRLTRWQHISPHPKGKNTTNQSRS